jgi:hypothetical protein
LTGSQKAAANYADMASKNIEGAISGLGTVAAGLDPDILAYLNTKKADAGAGAGAQTTGNTSAYNQEEILQILQNNPNLLEGLDPSLLQTILDNKNKAQ